MCESALHNSVPISDIMRYLMYHDEYGKRQRAIQQFNDLPSTMRKQLVNIDYAMAEQLCPHKMPIARLMLRAVEKLSGDGTTKT